MSALNQQEEVTDSGKDDENNVVAATSTDKGSGDSSCMKMGNNLNPKIMDLEKSSSSTTTDIIPKPLSPQETGIDQTEVKTPDEIDKSVSNFKLNQAEVNEMDNSNKLSENVVDQSEITDKNTSVSTNTPPTLEISIPNTELETSYKETTIDDVPESDFVLKWSDDEDDDVNALPLSDEALKNLDKELGIDDKLVVKEICDIQSTQNTINITNIRDPVEVDISKQIGEDNMEKTDMIVSIKEETSIEKPHFSKAVTLDNISDFIDKMPTSVPSKILNENKDIVQDQEKTIIRKPTGQSDVVIEEIAGHNDDNEKKLASQCDQTIKGVASQNDVQISVKELANQSFEPESMVIAEMSEAVSSSGSTVPCVNEDNIEPMDVEIPSVESEIKSQVSCPAKLTTSEKPNSNNEKSRTEGETAEVLIDKTIESHETKEEKGNEIASDETIVDITPFTDKDTLIQFRLDSEKPENNTIKTNKLNQISCSIEDETKLTKIDSNSASKLEQAVQPMNQDITFEIESNPSKTINQTLNERILHEISPIPKEDEMSNSKSDTIDISQNSTNQQNMKTNESLEIVKDTLFSTTSMETPLTCDVEESDSTKEMLQSYEANGNNLIMTSKEDTSNEKAETNPSKKLVEPDTTDGNITIEASNDHKIVENPNKENTSVIKVETDVSNSADDRMTQKESEEPIIKQENFLTAIEKDKLTENPEESITPNITNDSIKINTDHRINRPDVMLDIPTQEFDMDDFDDSSEKQTLTDKSETGDNDLTTKTVTEIVNQLSKESKVTNSMELNEIENCGIEMTQSNLDDKIPVKNEINVYQSQESTSEKTGMISVENISKTTEFINAGVKIPEKAVYVKCETYQTKDQISELELKEKEKEEKPVENNKNIEMDVSPAKTKDTLQKETEQDIEMEEKPRRKFELKVPENEHKSPEEKVPTVESAEKSKIISENYEKSTVSAAPASESADEMKIVPEKGDNNSDIEMKAVQPSTSKVELLTTEKTESTLTVSGKSNLDNVEEPQEVEDSLGLLAESSRVMEEEEEEAEPDEEEADDGDGDDDDDFDPDCEENSNQTGEHSEESNPPQSEIDIQEEGIDIEFNNVADKIGLDINDTTFDALLGDSTDVTVEDTDTEIATTASGEVRKDAMEKSETVIPEASDTVSETGDAKKPEDGRRGSLLADLLTKPRADLNLPEGAVKVDSSNDRVMVTSIVDLEGSSSDDDSQSKRTRRQTISLIQIAKQIEDAAKEITVTEGQTKPGEEKPKENKEKSKIAEIFNLDSDDDENLDKKEVSFIEKPKEGNQCINYVCTSDDSVPYYLADRITVAYYGAARRRRRPVCLNCLNVVNSRNEGLVSGIKDLRPLMSLRMARPTHTLLEISDSDSEGEEEPVGEEGARFIEDKLTDMLNDVWLKYKMDERLKETEDYLEAELEKMQQQGEEVDKILRECQDATDKLRVDLYSSFEESRKELPSIIIHDTPIASYACLETEEEPVDQIPVELRYPKRRASSAIETPAKKAAVPAATEDKRTTRSMYDVKTEEDKEVSVVRLSAEAAPADLPPAGEPVKPPLRVGGQVYAMKNQYGAWLRGNIIDIQPKTNEHQYTMCVVRFEHKLKNPCKALSARCIAYTEPSEVRMTIGTRVIALFKNSENTNKRGEFYYSGVIAEIPNPVNGYRYLVFFDDGYAQYVEHKHTRLVYESKTLVWEEVHPFSRDFVCNYLMKYPERPMVRMHPGHAVTVEWNGKWWDTKVIEVDAALVHVRFPDNRTEWIYRGSTRLQPLFTELQAARRGDRARLPRSTKANIKTNVPYVEYIRSDDQPKPEYNSVEDLRRQRSVAKKSTSIAQQITSAATDGVISRVVFYTPKNSVRPLKMVPHTCGPHCRRKDLLTLADLQTYNPLTKPLLSGWERQIVRHKSSRLVMYRAPCGRRVRDVRELHAYLRAVHSDMPVDLFDFNPNTHCLAEFVLSKTNVQKKDLSHGKENIPVPCVNYYDHSLPEFCSYNTERTPTAGVPLNLDPEFLCGCDCDDDCADKTKCACWKMTLEGARTIGIEGTDVGYHYRRLPEPLPSGIYECNSRCKCKSTCLNRVVQNPLQLKLQVFKTLNRGWGIRALNDVPKGAFICIYAGNLLTDATANLDGLNEGDEYLAELDYIEVVEAMKEGYEEDIPEADKMLDKKESKKSDSEPETDSTESEEEEIKEKDDIEDGDFQPKYMSLGLTEFNKRLRRRDKKKEKDDKPDTKPQMDDKPANKDDTEECITISDDEEVRVSLREPARFAAEESMTDSKVTSKYRSIRSYFGKDEACYIMDAKVQGNIGRYLNHSCSPNVFVQNVFVDTHDPRFPWVSFFALHHIPAGTELTWNYNYDIGSVPGKVLYCYCGAPNCRGRLL